MVSIGRDAKEIEVACGIGVGHQIRWWWRWAAAASPVSFFPKLTSRRMFSTPASRAFCSKYPSTMRTTCREKASEKGGGVTFLLWTTPSPRQPHAPCFACPSGAQAQGQACVVSSSRRCARKRMRCNRLSITFSQYLCHDAHIGLRSPREPNAAETTICRFSAAPAVLLGISWPGTTSSLSILQCCKLFLCKNGYREQFSSEQAALNQDSTSTAHHR